MQFHEDLNELIVELFADIEDIGDEEIWAFYEEKDGEQLFTDYRYKNDPAEKMPKGSLGEKVMAITAKELLPLLRKQKHQHPNF
ncbi:MULTISPECIES: hypothetical protein [Enterococcus]|uniref:hypothetical protein n=1 Tax=Enterococcus TaxID=1350 RepID=UPI00065DD3AA|nr:MULTISPECIES: hypothetical protein [Enterococcus]KAF1303888.1 hypothetical protein BAU16_03375 [Enterococcus sp. JM9B]